MSSTTPKIVVTVYELCKQVIYVFTYDH